MYGVGRTVLLLTAPAPDVKDLLRQRRSVTLHELLDVSRIGRDAFVDQDGLGQRGQIGIIGRIHFMPSGDGYTFEAPTRFDKVFNGVPIKFNGAAIPRPSYIKDGTKGRQHITVEDTFDGDYGRLLAAVYAAAPLAGNGVRPQGGPSTSAPAP